MTAWSLFPLPSRPEPVWGQTPHPFPGVTAESSETLTELMNQNSERFHIYFNYKGYHKWVFITNVLLRCLLIRPACQPLDPSSAGGMVSRGSEDYS